MLIYLNLTTWKKQLHKFQDNQLALDYLYSIFNSISVLGVDHFVISKPDNPFISFEVIQASILISNSQLFPVVDFKAPGTSLTTTRIGAYRFCRM